MAKSIDRVRDYFRARRLEIEIHELPASTRTAQLAADAVGSQLGQIVKSLVFLTADDDNARGADNAAGNGTPRTVLALVAGDRRADPAKIAVLLQTPRVRIANAEQVRARTGFAIGGVAPIAHLGAPIDYTLMDASLARFDLLWAAAGTPNAVFPIAREELL